MKDGDELFTKFIAIFQITGEKPLADLQLLQVALTIVWCSSVEECHLSMQFCQEYWDDAVIIKLQLEQK